MGDEKVEETTKLKEKESATENEEIEKPELTKFGEFCQRHGINSNLIMLKITLFVMYGGNAFSIRIKQNHNNFDRLVFKDQIFLYHDLNLNQF